eukprot:TRINITY_DN2035_c0_g1_i1.p1 TRINITY_DN2035_c0_g1~~TRINITY_DN2035_c0_g1_i1.p1  ORF type:complete len:682 (-),score=147.55 TRINITY_DN2035_c0_g1_i1:5399-7444(-)
MNLTVFVKAAESVEGLNDELKEYHKLPSQLTHTSSFWEINAVTAEENAQTGKSIASISTQTQHKISNEILGVCISKNKDFPAFGYGSSDEQVNEKHVQHPNLEVSSIGANKNIADKVEATNTVKESAQCKEANEITRLHVRTFTKSSAEIISHAETTEGTEEGVGILDCVTNHTLTDKDLVLPKEIQGGANNQTSEDGRTLPLITTENSKNNETSVGAKEEHMTHFKMDVRKYHAEPNLPSSPEFTTEAEAMEELKCQTMEPENKLNELPRKTNSTEIEAAWQEEKPHVCKPSTFTPTKMKFKDLNDSIGNPSRHKADIPSSSSDGGVSLGTNLEHSNLEHKSVGAQYDSAVPILEENFESTNGEESDKVKNDGAKICEGIIPEQRVNMTQASEAKHDGLQTQSLGRERLEDREKQYGAQEEEIKNLDSFAQKDCDKINQESTLECTNAGQLIAQSECHLKERESEPTNLSPTTDILVLNVIHHEADYQVSMFPEAKQIGTQHEVFNDNLDTPSMNKKDLPSVSLEDLGIDDKYDQHLKLEHKVDSAGQSTLEPLLEQNFENTFAIEASTKSEVHKMTKLQTAGNTDVSKIVMNSTELRGKRSQKPEQYGFIVTNPPTDKSFDVTEAAKGDENYKTSNHSSYMPTEVHSLLSDEPSASIKDTKERNVAIYSEDKGEKMKAR